MIAVLLFPDLAARNAFVTAARARIPVGVTYLGDTPPHVVSWDALDALEGELGPYTRGEIADLVVPAPPAVIVMRKREVERATLLGMRNFINQVRTILGLPKQAFTSTGRAIGSDANRAGWTRLPCRVYRRGTVFAARFSPQLVALLKPLITNFVDKEPVIAGALDVTEE